MSTVQQLAEKLLPASWFCRVRNSSEHWMIQCTKCNSERSVWDAGGIRFGASSAGKRIAAKCSRCDAVVAARVYYKADGEGTDPNQSSECSNGG